MRIVQQVRASDWWIYKIPPILVVFYLVASFSDKNITDILFCLLFVMGALIAGASFVSIINDYTDIEQDRLAQKTNFMEAMSHRKRLLMLVVSISCGLVFTLAMSHNIFALITYVLSYLSFVFYSCHPIRFKERKWLGVFADAAGSQVFPFLFVAFFTSKFLEVTIGPLFFWLTSVWALCSGIRGILWHQLYDKSNDIKSNLNMVVQNLNYKTLKRIGGVLVALELTAVVVICIKYQLMMGSIAFLLYALYLLLRIKLHDVEIVALNHRRKSYAIFMFEFYQVFWPVSILVTLGLQDLQFLILLILHLLLFHKSIYLIYKSITV